MVTKQQPANIAIQDERAKPVLSKTFVSDKDAKVSLASRAIARLEAAAAAINESEATRRDRTLQLVSTKDRPFSALIRHGRTTIEIEGDDFAVSTE
jgi:hypothetical protein